MELGASGSRVEHWWMPPRAKLREEVSHYRNAAETIRILTVMLRVVRNPFQMRWLIVQWAASVFDSTSLMRTFRSRDREQARALAVLRFLAASNFADTWLR